MPQPDHRPACVLASGLEHARVWELVDKKVSLTLACDNCHHKADWPPEMLARKFAKAKAARMGNVVHKLRCSRCRSNYLRIWAAPQ
jgi:hypothetical protein